MMRLIEFIRQVKFLRLYVVSNYYNRVFKLVFSDLQKFNYVITKVFIRFYEICKFSFTHLLLSVLSIRALTNIHANALKILLINSSLLGVLSCIRYCK